MQAGQLQRDGHELSEEHVVREIVGGEPYDYYPLGEHVVVAPGVCGGRPTFKYTRLEVSLILSLIAMGETIEQVVHAYSQSQLTPAAVQEAIHLANEALLEKAQAFHPAA